MIEFARRMEKVRASDIRELLKITDKPGMISFAGGLPAPELFPVERLKGITQKVLETSGAEALQYAATEGFTPLRQKIADRMNKRLTRVAQRNILITNERTAGLDLQARYSLMREMLFY